MCNVKVVGGSDEMFEEKQIISDKKNLFAAEESELHYVKVSPDSEEYLKVWIKQPTWLQVEQATTSVLKLNPKTQEMDLDLNAMYRFMVDNFIDKTEPSLSAVELIRLTPFVGNQLKDLLPNPFEGLQEDGSKNEE